MDAKTEFLWSRIKKKSFGFKGTLNGAIQPISIRTEAMRTIKNSAPYIEMW